MRNILKKKKTKKPQPNQSTKIRNTCLEANLQQSYLFLVKLLSIATVGLEHLFVVY